MTNELREALAAYAHDAWAGWMRYMFSKCELYARGTTALVIPDWAVERWQRQMMTPYAELPESERASDLVEADKMGAIMEEYLNV